MYGHSSSFNGSRVEIVISNVEIVVLNVIRLKVPRLYTHITILCGWQHTYYNIYFYHSGIQK